MRISDWSSDVCSSDLQHQALLIIRAAGNDGATVGLIAERLILKPHSATGLVGRLEALGLLKRLESAQDRRRAILKLTPRARRQLAALTAIHRQELKRLRPVLGTIMAQQIGRASCREIVCNDVEITEGAVSLKKKRN